MELGSTISRLRPPVGRWGFAGLVAAGVALHGLDSALAASGGSAVWRLSGAVGWLCWAAAARGALAESARPGGVAPGTTDAAGPRVSRIVGWLGVPMVVALGALSRQGGLASPAAEADAHAAEAIRAWPAWASIAVFALAPALAEESFFRGAALRALARRHGAWLAWTVSAGTFALAHPDRAAAAAVFGAALAGLALASGRSREAIAAHALHNLLGLRALGL